MINAKGRNGFFVLERSDSFVADGFRDEPPTAYVSFFSNSPHTRSAPIKFDGPPLELVRLFRQLARELAAQHRAAKARNSEQERKTNP